MSWTSTNNMWDYYQQEWLPLGELLTEIEKIGVLVNKSYLKQIEEVAKQDNLKARGIFY